MAIIKFHCIWLDLKSSTDSCKSVMQLHNKFRFIPYKCIELIKSKRKKSHTHNNERIQILRARYEFISCAIKGENDVKYKIIIHGAEQKNIEHDSWLSMHGEKTHPKVRPFNRNSTFYYFLHLQCTNQ